MAILLLIILVIAIGSKVTYQDNFAVLTGSVILEANTEENIQAGKSKTTTFSIDYPEGFNRDNCVVVSYARTGTGGLMYSYGWKSSEIDSMDMYRGLDTFIVSLYNDDERKIQVSIGRYAQSEGKVDYKIVLMKLDATSDDYVLGDVNGDGDIDSDDLALLQDYITNHKPLTKQQFKAGDINKDGNIDLADTLKLSQYINGLIESLE